MEQTKKIELKRTQIKSSELLQDFNALAFNLNEYETLKNTLDDICILKKRANASEFILSNKTLEQIEQFCVVAFATNERVCELYCELVNNANKSELKRVYAHAFNNSMVQAKKRVKELSTNLQATTFLYDRVNLKKFAQKLYIDLLTNNYKNYLRIDFDTRTLELIDNEQQKQELKKWNEQQKAKEQERVQKQKTLQELNEQKLAKLNEQIAKAQNKLQELKNKLDKTSKKQ